MLAPFAPAGKLSPGRLMMMMHAPHSSASSGADPATANKPCILCGTDFSGQAAEATDAAAALSIHRQETLLLVHSVAETFDDQLPDDARHALIPSLEGQVHAEAQRARALGATVEEAVLPGWPDDGIQERAARSRARLLVFGYPEFGALHRWLPGSVAEMIAESSSIPTLVVHAAAPFERWVRKERPLRILIVTDLTLDSDAALRWVADWGRDLPCEITIGSIERAAGPSETTRRERQRPDFASSDPDIHVIPRSAQIDEDLIRLAGEISADLLVIGTRRWNGLERTSHRSIPRELLRHATISVACIPNSSTAENNAATNN